MIKLKQFRQYINRKFFVNKSYYQSNDKKFNQDYVDSNRNFCKIDNVYQNDIWKKWRNDRHRMNIIIKIEKRFKQSKRNFDRDNKKQFYDERKYNRNRNRNIKYKKKDVEIKSKNDESKEKAKIFVTAKNNLEKSDCDLKNFHQFENFSYYDSNYDNAQNDESDITINFAVTSDVICRQCKAFFSSNNVFYKHLKFCRNSVNTIFIIFSNITSFVFRFNVDANNKNVKTDYDFKEWQYTSVDVIFAVNTKFLSNCINIETEITLKDIQFFKFQIKNISIKIMTVSNRFVLIIITKRNYTTSSRMQFYFRYRLCQLLLLMTNLFEWST